jgi:hypothetical protein
MDPHPDVVDETPPPALPEPAPERVLERQRILFSTGPYAEEGTWTYRGGRLSLLVRRPGGEPGIGSCGACVRWSAGRP